MENHENHEKILRKCRKISGKSWENRGKIREEHGKQSPVILGMFVDVVQKTIEVGMPYVPCFIVPQIAKSGDIR